MLTRVDFPAPVLPTSTILPCSTAIMQSTKATSRKKRSWGWESGKRRLLSLWASLQRPRDVFPSWNATLKTCMETRLNLSEETVGASDEITAEQLGYCLPTKMKSPDQTICWWRERPKITKLDLKWGKKGDLVASSQLSKLNVKDNHEWFSAGHRKNSSTTRIEPKTGRPLPLSSQLPVTVCAHQGYVLLPCTQ
jgi:hypothetical protein